MFGGGNWSGFGDYLGAKTRKVQQQLQNSLASERARESSSSGSSSSSRELRWWNRYVQQPSSLFSSFTFYIDGLQRLQGYELISTGYSEATDAGIGPRGPLRGPRGGPPGAPPTSAAGNFSGPSAKGKLEGSPWSFSGVSAGGPSRNPPGGPSGDPPKGPSGGPPKGPSAGPCVNEYVVDAVQLKRVLVAHGGSISIMTGKGVTHVLVDNLALGNQKWRKLRDRGGWARSYVVVRCSWVFSCIAAKRLLSPALFKPTGLQLANQHLLLQRWAVAAGGRQPQQGVAPGQAAEVLGQPVGSAAALDQQEAQGEPGVAAAAEMGRTGDSGRVNETVAGRPASAAAAAVAATAAAAATEGDGLLLELESSSDEEQQQQQQQGQPHPKKIRTEVSYSVADLAVPVSAAVDIAAAAGAVAAAGAAAAAPFAGAAAACATVAMPGQATASSSSAAAARPAAAVNTSEKSNTLAGAHGITAATVTAAQDAAAAQDTPASALLASSALCIPTAAPAAPTAAAAAAGVSRSVAERTEIASSAGELTAAGVAAAGAAQTGAAAAGATVAGAAVGAASGVSSGEGNRGTVDCRRPDFVSSFFEHSRLHFIGAWQNRCASMLSRLLHSSSSSSRGPQQQVVLRWVDASITSKELEPLLLPLGLTLSHESDFADAAAAAHSPLLLRSPNARTAAAGGATALPGAAATTTAAEGRWILHVDFDAFFVSVALLKHPHLKDKPVAVCHSRGHRTFAEPTPAAVAAAAGKAPAAGAAAAAAVGAGGRGRGTSEIASCNYIARSQGVQKGMWLRPALDRCPSLVLLPYDFEGIERASEGLFQAALSLSHRLAPLSCDETFIQICFPLLTQAEGALATQLTSSSSISSNQNAASSSSSNETTDHSCCRSSNSASSGSDYNNTGSSNNDSSNRVDEAEIVADVCMSLRKAIIGITGCNVSVGAGCNCLLAKLATAAAKPSVEAADASKGSSAARAETAAVIQREGVCVVKPGAASAAAFVGRLLLRQVPGVGPTVASKVAAAARAAGVNVKTCTDIQTQGKDSLQLLQTALGRKRGAQLWWLCHGVDVRPPPAALPAVPGLGNSAAAAGPSAGTTAGASAAGGSGVPASGSLSISVNWGIRLQQEADALSLLKQMALEGHKRLKASRLYSAKISAKILYRRPGAPVDTVKFLGCGICDSARGSRVIGSRSSGGSKRTRSDGFGVQSAEDLYTELEALWRESLSDVCPLEDYRGITLLLQQLRTEQQEGALRQQQQHLQRNLLSVAFSSINSSSHDPSSNICSSNSINGTGKSSSSNRINTYSGTGKSNSSSSSSSSSTPEPCFIVVESVEQPEGESPSQSQTPQQDQQQCPKQMQRHQECQHRDLAQKEQVQQEAPGGSVTKAVPTAPFDGCFIVDSGSSSDSERGSSRQEARTPVLATPSRTAAATKPQNAQQSSGNSSATADSAAAVSAAAAAAVFAASGLKTPAQTPKRPRGSPEAGQLQQSAQQQQQWGARTPDSQASTPRLKTMKLNRSHRMQTAQTPASERIGGRRLQRSKKALLEATAATPRMSGAAAAAAAAPAAPASPVAGAGRSPMSTQRSLVEYLPNSGKASRRASSCAHPKQQRQQQQQQQQQPGSSSIGRAQARDAVFAAAVSRAASSALPNVVSLLTQNPDGCSSSGGNSPGHSKLDLAKEQKGKQDGDCCCAASGSSNCCCSPEGCVAQCMSLVCPPNGRKFRPPLPFRIAAAAQPVMQLLLHHAAAKGAAAACRRGTTALVVTAVSARITAAATNSSSNPGPACTQHTQQLSASDTAGPTDSPPPTPSAASNSPTAAAAAAETKPSSANPAATASSPAQETSLRKEDSDREASAIEEESEARANDGDAEPPAGAEGAYWECLADALEGFSGALLLIFERLGAVGAHEERQLLFRALQRLLQTPEARATVAGAAADDAATRQTGRWRVAPQGHPFSLALLLLKLLACPAGRLVWPLLLHRARDIVCFS